MTDGKDAKGNVVADISLSPSSGGSPSTSDASSHVTYEAPYLSNFVKDAVAEGTTPVPLDKELDDYEKQNPEEYEYWADKYGPTGKVSNRHEVIALAFAMGATPKDVAEKFGITPQYASLLNCSTRIKKRVHEIREKYWGTDMARQFQSLAPQALAIAQQLMLGSDDFVNAKVSERWDAAKWVLEKVSGKPKQEVTVDSSFGFKDLLQAVDELKKAQAEGDTKKVAEFIDVTPKETNSIDDWVNNLKDDD